MVDEKPEVPENIGEDPQVVEAGAEAVSTEAEVSAEISDADVTEVDAESGGGAENLTEEVLPEPAPKTNLEAEEFPAQDNDDYLQEEALEPGENALSAPQNIGLLIDVTLNITVELGRRSMKFGEVLALGKGSLVELNKIADEPVDIYVNQSKIAEGEVVVVDDHFGVRITKLMNKDRLAEHA